MRLLYGGGLGVWKFKRPWIILCLEQGSREGNTPESAKRNGWFVQMRSMQDWEPLSLIWVGSLISSSIWWDIKNWLKSSPSLESLSPSQKRGDVVHVGIWALEHLWAHGGSTHVYLFSVWRCDQFEALGWLISIYLSMFTHLHSLRCSVHWSNGTIADNDQ